MTQLSRWMMRGAVAIALAWAMAAVSGCASDGAQNDKEWRYPPGYVPFSA